MKSEHEIAKENVEEMFYLKPKKGWLIIKYRSEEHLASCQREKKFWRGIKITYLRFKDNEKCDDRKKDIQKAIKTYSDGGIK